MINIYFQFSHQRKYFFYYIIIIWHDFDVSCEKFPKLWMLMDLYNIAAF